MFSSDFYYLLPTSFVASQSPEIEAQIAEPFAESSSSELSDILEVEEELGGDESNQNGDTSLANSHSQVTGKLVSLVAFDWLIFHYCFFYFLLLLVFEFWGVGTLVCS